MSQDVVTFADHEDVLLGVVNPAQLTDAATEQLDTDVTFASNERLNVPVVLDMSKVKFVPSVALGALANLRKGLNLQGRELILIGVNRQVRGVLRTTRLDSLIKVFPTLDDALSEL